MTTLSEVLGDLAPRGNVSFATMGSSLAWSARWSRAVCSWRSPSCARIAWRCAAARDW